MSSYVRRLYRRIWWRCFLRPRRRIHRLTALRTTLRRNSTNHQGPCQLPKVRGEEEAFCFFGKTSARLLRDCRCGGNAFVVRTYGKRPQRIVNLQMLPHEELVDGQQAAGKGAIN